MKLFGFEISESVVALAVSAIGLVIACASKEKSETVANALGTTVKELSSKELPVDISERVIEKAIRAKVDGTVSEMVRKAASEAEKEVTADVKDKVTREINARYEDVKSDVARELKAQVGRVDISAVKKQVVEDAKEEAMDKFKDSLDEVLEKFDGQLNNVGAIYSHIAKKMSEK